MDEMRLKEFKQSIIDHTVQYAELDDKILVGCDNCGKCCINANLNLNAYDLCRMSRSFKDEKELQATLDVTFSKYGFEPIVVNKNELCIHGKIQNNGDIKCSLEDNKPYVCNTPFLARTHAFSMDSKDNVWGLVPLDKDIKPIDNVEYYINKTVTKYVVVEEGIEHCNCLNKKEITVREYIGEDAIKNNKNTVAAFLLKILPSRYVNMARLMNIVLLSEHSKINKDDDQNVNDVCSKVIKFLTHLAIEIYFYGCMNKNVKSDEDFYKETLKQFDNLQKDTLPKLRILYKYLEKVFSAGDEDEFNDIIDSDTICIGDRIQARFDKYYKKYESEISSMFISIIPSMMTELFKASGKTMEDVAQFLASLRDLEKELNEDK